MLGSQCTENPPALISSSGEGNNIEEIGGLKTYVTGDQDSKLAVLLLSDAFGYEAPNLRKLADKVAASGFLDKGCEDAKTIIAALKSKGVSKIGAAGFCWGGMVTVRLAKFDCIEAAVVLHPGPITVEQINGDFF
ncbi:endo-1 3 [Phtheirospermum japonicum]|uniref:Endo-1 3 n=1 Tax=Phtheirospermum japonicum TaxID=374723 RepID=A0A830BA58_9LAMI|nr:endo-1 3 [Phtheirospermum japonicum]